MILSTSDQTDSTEDQPMKRLATIRKGYAGYPPLTFLMTGAGFGFSGPNFGLSLTGPSGQATVTVVIESSADLVNWLPLQTNTFTGILSFTDSQAGANSRRFYRARVP